MIRTLTFIVLGSLWMMMTPPGFSQGGLMITPQRVIFEGRMRTQSITLVNRSEKTQRYRLLYSEMYMSEAGDLMVLEEPEGGKFASSLVRAARRQVTLPPGQSQKVRLLPRLPSQLEPGEYRSHLVFRVIPGVGGQTLHSEGGNTNAVGIQLTPLISASIPIIVRKGDLTASVEISHANLQTSAQQSHATLQLSFQRHGDRSVYGDIAVQWVSPLGHVSDLRSVKGMAIYTDVTKRTLAVDLPTSKGVALDTGYLRITYTARASGAILATHNLALTP